MRLMPTDANLPSSRPVLILGGGIHGAAVARELALNGVPVVLVDAHDLATGATSKSSRLIHGGLRYLEYGDVHLVHESLLERRRLLELAPHFVRPLRLFIPTSRRWSGLLRSVLGFFKLERTRLGRRLMGRNERRAPRGFWPVRMALWMYDLLSWGDTLKKSRGSRVEGHKPADGPSTNVSSSLTRTSSLVTQPFIDSSRYRWLCEYSDAQMLWPERCVFALLAEAEQRANERDRLFRVVPHATLEWDGSTVTVPRVSSPPFSGGGETLAKTSQHLSPQSRVEEAEMTIEPALVINVSGAWGDLTLKGIDAGTTPLFAGTKGSHFVTRHAALKAALGEFGVYAETGDRRLAFILPFGDAVLVGTTDERWEGPPELAVATDAELDYLINVVATVFGLKLTRGDIDCHYSGVRPLPRTNDENNAAVSRDHALIEHRLHGVPVVTLVGGKLTTFRSVAEQLTNRVLKELGRTRTASTEHRVLFGGEDFPRDPATWPNLWQQWAAEFGTTVDEVAALWPLYGTRTKQILTDVAALPSQPVTDSAFTRRTVVWVIEHEWTATLDDLIERRLLLVFAPRLSLATLHDLAKCLVETGRLRSDERPSVIEATRIRLEHHYGRVIATSTVTG
jgi:glycerol-3-phosphate dehydrogenase